jgi:hypothetical protein
MIPPTEQRDYCPRCGVAYEPLQEYCLECGARLPTNRGVVGVLASGWQRRFSWYPGDWVWPVALLLLLTVVATAVVLVADKSRSSAAAPKTATTNVPFGPGATRGTVPVAATRTLPNAPAPTITTGPLPKAPGSASTPRATVPTARPNPNALAVWPTGEQGFTTVLESVPVAAGRANAVARARRAKQNGLRDVGVLVSSGYSSLHPGYYVIFAGIYRTQADASAALPNAHQKGFPDAYQTRITP